MRLAVYLERSSRSLVAAWALDAARVRALPRFAVERPALDLVVSVANASSFAAHRGLLGYAEELRDRFDPVRDGFGKAQYATAIIAYALALARRRCGLEHDEEAAFARFSAEADAASGHAWPSAIEVAVRGGHAADFPFPDGPFVADDAIVALVRERGALAFALAAGRGVKIPLAEPVPLDLAAQLFPLITGTNRGGLAHAILAPESGAHELPVEAAAAFTAMPHPVDGFLGTTRKTAAVLAVAAGVEGAEQDARVLAALQDFEPLFAIREGLHFPRVRAMLSARRATLLSPRTTPLEREVVDALEVFELDDRAADKRLTAALKALTAADSMARLLPGFALFRLAMERGRPVAAYRIVQKLPKPNRQDLLLEIARVYADAGDLAGAAEVLSTIEKLNFCRREQLNPLALAALRALVA